MKPTDTRILEFYREGLSIPEIASRFGNSQIEEINRIVVEENY